jgi:putative oxidoreductase
VQTYVDRVLATSSSRVATVLRIAAGAVFIGFGPGKFIRHTAETNAFHRYGLPRPSEFAYLIGSIELVCGLLLVLGLLVRPAALVLAGDMIGAIATGGRVDGGPVHLVLAPGLLVALLLLVCSGAGAWSLDTRLGQGRGGNGKVFFSP